MTNSTIIDKVLTGRFGAIRADDVRFTRRNALIDQVDLQFDAGCINAVGRTLAKAQSVDGRRAALDVGTVENSVEGPGMVFLFEDASALIRAVDWIKSGADLAVETWAMNHCTGAVQRNAAPKAIDAVESDASCDASDRVARTLAALDHSAPVGAAPVDAVPSSVRKVAALLGCSVEAAAYIDALETRVARQEEKVAELRYDVRRVKRAA